ncbi:MAG: hypothetical protein JWP38_2877 [Herbaspirillum sp.]|jgi:uncharacterized SAM-binding protein YcdF (DUF218 family)|nr:hypothetical protein [Herbaspirillum sp.]
MTIPLFFCLIALAIGLGLLKRKRASATLSLIVFFLFVVIGFGFAPAWLLAQLQMPYLHQAPIAWRAQNAIILLGAGNDKIRASGEIEVGLFGYGRVAKTAALYKACKQTGKACTVIVSGGDARHQGRAEAVVYGAYLRDLGVADADMILESSSMNTWQNAQFTARILKEHDFDRVLLVTSGMHLARSMIYFAHAGVDAAPVRAEYVTAKPAWLPSAYAFLATDAALHEYIGIARYRLYERMGWNAASVAPGSA